MTNIYNHHDKAFAQVSAYVVLKDGERVATIALKFPKDGAGRLWAYVHWIGTPMVRGFAGGYGYDKRSAAVASAARKLQQPLGACLNDPKRPQDAFVAALYRDDGEYFDRRLENAGFTVLQAV
jgi:hypothetical protein